MNTFDISQLIKSKKFNEVEQEFISFISESVQSGSRLRANNNFDLSHTTDKDSEEDNYTLCNQLATLINMLFSDKNYKPSQKMTDIFLTYKVAIDWIYSASMWGNTDALIEHLQLTQTDKVGNLKLNQKRLSLLLMLITLNSKIKLPWKTLFQAMPSQAISAYIGLITQSIPALTKESNRNFNYLLESAKDLPTFDLSVVEDLGKLNYPFFSCSYATSKNKYEFKKWLSKLIRHNLPQWLSPEVKTSIDNICCFEKKQKMKLGVMLELYSKDHAMYRCYNSALAELSEQYELIAFTDENEAQKSDLTIFDKVILFKDLFDINANTQLICQETVDILFYPSIGMKFWGIYLSQLRLAPIQMMMGGHPSSSFSPEIDYFLFSGDTFSAEDLQPYLSEKLILLSDLGGNFIKHTLHSDLDANFIENHNQFIEDEEEIIIGINGVMTKVTFDIIDACKQITLKANKKVRFVFFSSHNNNSLAYLAAKKQIMKTLKNIDVSCYSNYLTYMQVISKCHFLLPTIPFGGTNSNVDAITLNKPKLFLKGYAHLYTRTDQAEWEHVGLVNELGCNNTDDMIEKAVVLVNDKEQRKKLHQKFIDKNCYQTMFSQGKSSQNILSSLINKAITEDQKQQKNQEIKLVVNGD